MMNTRRQFHMSSILWLVLVGLLMLTGCMNNAAAPPVNNQVIEQEAQPAPQTDDAAQWPRTITDARGVAVTLAEKPQRLAATTWQITENLMALDTPPIAADTVAVMAQWASMKDYFEKYEVESIGDSHLAINLEKLTAMQPDLILASTGNAEIYEQLEQIAPVFVFDSLFFDWEGSLRAIASVIGEEARADLFIDQLLTQIAQTRENVGHAEQSVGFVSAAQGALYTFNVDQLAMYYDAQKGLGLTVPDTWPSERAALSIEGFSEINPDTVFLSANDDMFMEELEKSSVWHSLDAVKNDRVFKIDVSGLTGGPLAVQYGVHTVKEALIK